MNPVGNLAVGLACLAVAAVVPAAAAPTALTIDARQAPPPPAPLPFAVGGRAPSGETLGANGRYLTRDGRPWFPVMGEFHYARYPADEWEREILKMKAGGIQVVSTYVFWIFQEESEGRFDWSGQRDLRRFVQLCGRHGLGVWLRIGPWAHGEVRNGGLPDWVVAGPTRQNDPAYLARVRTYFGEIGRQVAGLGWREGGPIIGLQIENEYHPPSGGEAHLRRLRELARAAGLVAPFTTVTGWDRAVVPAADFLPVFGGYTEQFWAGSLRPLPPNPNFFFTPIRAEDNVGSDLRPKDPSYQSKFDGYPYLTAEMGGGMAIAYHRRPVMGPDDSAAAALVKLGSGISLLGYYMYHGGTNPDGRTPLQETQAAWNGYNDMEAKSYDFQAPIGEDGQLRESYRTLKLLHLFLADFGGELAPMTSAFPTQQPASLADTATPRAAFRSDGKRGFLFINNFERNYPLPDHPGFQVTLRLASGDVRIPRQPIRIPSGAYPIWPVNLDVGGVTLRYATAEPVCRLASSDLLVFFAWPGVRPEFSFATADSDRIEAPGARVARTPGGALVEDLPPGTDLAIRVSHAGGKVVCILVLSRAQALNLWKARLAGTDRLLLSPAGLYFESDRVHVSSRDPQDFRVGLFPAIAGGVPGFHSAGRDGIFQEFAAEPPAVGTAVTARQIRLADPAPRARLSPNPRRRIVLEPTDADFDRAAVWAVSLPPMATAPGARPVLTVAYVGEAARLYAGNRLLDDNFYRGTPFEFGLWRLTAAEWRAGLELRILPLRRDTPVYLPAGATPVFDAQGEALALRDAALVWEPEAVMDLGAGDPGRAGTGPP
jgi:hypothetical protein